MTDQMVEFALNIGIWVVLIVIAYVWGSLVERRHFRRIIEKEDALRHIQAFAIRHLPEDLPLADPKLVAGSAVISVDYFKKFAADIRGIMGGRMGTYESLLERARREAILRMKEEAGRQGGDIVLNVKFETSRIGTGSGRATVSVEALAYGTAYSRQGGRA